VEDGVTIWSWATSQELKAKHGKKLLSQSAEAIG